ncbi:MAG: hypothetical protein AAF797_05270 [Planctomycetota bacterium]
MISVSLIDRCLIKNDHDRLLRELNSNGLVMPRPLRVSLAQAPTAVRALGLRRLSELTYGSTPQTRRLTQHLLNTQHPLGHFLPQSTDAHYTTQACPLTTATVLSALQRVAQDLPHNDIPSGLEDARQRGMQALAQMQQTDGLFAPPAPPTDPSPEHRQLTSAFIAYLLATDLLFRETIDFWSLAQHFDRPDSPVTPETTQLWAMAQLTESPNPPSRSRIANHHYVIAA